MFRMAALAAATLALQSCFFAPGKFNSTMELRRDGRFSFAYAGEVMFLDPNEMDRGGDGGGDRCFGTAPAPERNDRSQNGSGRPPVTVTVPVATPRAPVPAPENDDELTPVISNPEAWKERPCTAAEKAERAEERERRRREQAELSGALFGFNPDDPASVQAFIAEMKRYKGWRDIRHRGGNRFDVDYRIEGALGADYVFPVFDRVLVMSPFVTARPRADGSVEVRAPFMGLGTFPGMMSAAAMGGGMGKMPSKPDDPWSQAFKSTDGTFTLITDGEVRANNTADGPAARGADKVLSWRVNTQSREVPRTLIQLR